jgi:ribonuclease P protein component
MDFEREQKPAQGAQYSSAAVPRAENGSQLVFPRSRPVLLFETGRFRRADRILCTRDFRRVVKSGKRATSGSFVVVIAPSAEVTATESDENRKRLGITVSKRVGNAVVRNRVKRSIREWFRQVREVLPGGSDIVVIARRTARDLSSPEIAAVLDGMIHGARAQGGGRSATEFR